MIKKILSLFTSKQFMRFVGVGLANTVNDYLIFNILFHFTGKQLASNMVSTTVALTVSFFLNSKLVFTGHNSTNKKRTMALFFACSLFSIWVIQNIALSIFYKLLLHTSLKTLSNILLVNIAKTLGVGFSLVTNYLSYHYIVFPHKPVEPDVIV